MRLAVVGATGRTGSRLIDVALQRGHTVRALARTPPEAAPRPGLTWIEGDVLDPSAVARLASGSEAVLVALGPTTDAPPDLCRRGTTTIVAACRAFRIRRVVVVTGAMIGHPRDRLAMLLRTMWRTYAVVRAAQAADREAQERVVEDSGLDWTIVRPPRLIEGERSEGVVAGSDLFVGARAQATIGDVVDVMLDAVERDMWVRSGVTVMSDTEAAAELDPAEGPFGTGMPIPAEVQWDIDGEESESQEPTLLAAAEPAAAPPARDPARPPPPAAPAVERVTAEVSTDDWEAIDDLDGDERA